MAIQDQDNDDDGMFSGLRESMDRLTGGLDNAALALAGVVPQTGLLNATLEGLTSAFNSFRDNFNKDIVQSNDSLVAVNSSLSLLISEYSQTIADSGLPIRTALDTLSQFELAGFTNVGPAVTELAGVMSLTNQSQKDFIKLVTDTVVFGGFDQGETEQLAQNMLSVSDKFGISFDKLVTALEPVATNMAKLSLVSEDAALKNTELVTELAGTVGQDSIGLLRNVIEELGSFKQISKNEFAFPELQKLRDQLQEGAITAEEFKDQLPVVVSQLEEFVGPILQKREGTQTFERIQAGELFNIELLAQLKALSRQVEIGNAIQEAPEAQGFRTLQSIQISLLDSFYAKIAELPQDQLELMAENLGRIAGFILEIGAAVAPVVGALVESITDYLREEYGSLEAGLGKIIGGILSGPEGILRGVLAGADFVGLGLGEDYDAIVETAAELLGVQADSVSNLLRQALSLPSDERILGRSISELRRDLSAERLEEALGVSEEIANRSGITPDRSGTSVRSQIIDNLLNSINANQSMTVMQQQQLLTAIQELNADNTEGGLVLQREIQTQVDNLRMDLERARQEREAAAAGGR